MESDGNSPAHEKPISETGSLVTLPSSGESTNYGFLGGGGSPHRLQFMSQPPLPKVAGHPRSIAVAQYQHDLSGGESRLSDRGRAWPNEHSCSPAAQHPRESPSTEPTADVQPWPRERVLMPQKPPSIFDSRIVGVEWRRELQRSHLLQPGYQRYYGASPPPYFGQQIGLCEKALRSGPYGGSRQESIL